MLPGTIKLSPMIEGDTWLGIPSISVGVETNGVTGTPDVPLASVRMQFRQCGARGRLYVELTSADLEIEILDAPSWSIQIHKKLLGLPAGSYVFDIEFTDDDGNIYTLLKGVQEVQAGITR